jgi:hypothetical protein
MCQIEKRGSDHPRLPKCDLTQLSVHVNVLHWHPTQPRWKILRMSSICAVNIRSVVISHYFICLAISLWIELQKSSTVHLPLRRTTGEL